MDDVVEELIHQYKISSDKDPVTALAHYDHIQGHDFFKRKGVIEWKKLNNDQKIECVKRYLDWVAKEQKENV